MDDRLRVRVLALEAAPSRLELRTKLDVVVDLPVEDHDDPTVVAGLRLSARREVDDGEPAHAHVNALVLEGAVIVGAAVDERPHHGLEPARHEGACVAGDPAHQGGSMLWVARTT